MHINILQLSGLVVKYFYVLQYLSSKLDEVLMCRVLAHVVVSIFFALELYYEAVCERTLEYSSATTI
jgi:hypothetical protein